MQAITATLFRDENGIVWQKPEISVGQGACPGIAKLINGRFGITNIDQPGGAIVNLNKAELAALINGAKNGEYDHLVA